MDTSDKLMYADFKLVRESFDLNVTPQLVSFRTEYYDQLERLGNRFLRELRVQVGGNSDYLKLLDVVDRYRLQLDAFAVKFGQKDFKQDFYQAVGNWQHELPTRQSYHQSDICFNSLESDTFLVTCGKVLKRSKRSVKHSDISIRNTFRKVFKKDMIPLPVSTHQIRWVRVSKSISVELMETYVHRMFEDLRWLSVFAAHLNEICDHGSEAVRCEQELRRFENFVSETGKVKQFLERDTVDLVDGAFEAIKPVLPYMGTFQESRRYFNSDILDQRERHISRKLDEMSAQWVTDCTTRLSQLEIDIDLNRYNIKFSQILADYKQHVVTTVLESSTPVIRDAVIKLQSLADSIEQNDPAVIRTKKFAKLVSGIRTEVESDLSRNFADPLSSIFDNQKADDWLESALSKIIMNDEILPESSVVFDRKAPEPISPILKTEKINFRSELTTYIKNDLFRKLRRLPGPFTSQLESFRNDIDDVMQVASVNLQLAIELLDDEHDFSEEDQKIVELIHDGLDRAAKRALELGNKLDALVQKFTSEVDVISDRYLTVCRDAMRDDNYLYIKSKNREALVVSRAIDWRTRTTTQLIKIWDQILLWQRYLGKTIRNIFNRIRSLLGFASSDESTGYVESGAAEFLSDTEARLSELPLIYRRLFAEDALYESRFFKGRSVVQSMMKDSYALWQRGHFANFIIVGEKGSGKTSCIELVPKLIGMPIEKIIRGSISHTTWVEKDLLDQLADLIGVPRANDRFEFIKHVLELPERKIVALEGFQNIYLRHINGFDALEAFLLIISQTSKKVYWLLSSSRYGWELLNKMYQTNGYFSHVRTIDNVTPETIEDIIMARHRVSGYDLNFQPSQSLKSTRTYKKLETDPLAQQKLIRKEFFKGLCTVSEGNIAIAMQYWLRSIRNSGVDTIDIAPFSDVNVKLGDAFTHDDVFTLGALVQHDDLTIDQLALVLNISTGNARLMLSKLASRSILVARNDRYYLNHLLYRHIVNLLKNKNVIH